MKKLLKSCFVLFTALLLLTLILAISLYNYDLQILGYFVIIGVFIYPFTFLFINLLFKKYNLKKTFLAIGISVIYLVAFYLLFDLIFPGRVNSDEFLYSLGSIVIASLIYLALSCMVVKAKKLILFKNAVNYIVALLFNIIIFNTFSEIAFDLGFVFSLIISVIMAVGITFLENRFIKIKPSSKKKKKSSKKTR